MISTWYPPPKTWNSATPSWHHTVCKHLRCVLLHYVFGEEEDPGKDFWTSHMLPLVTALAPMSFLIAVHLDVCTLWPMPRTSDRSNAKLSECCESYTLSFAGCLCIEKLMAHHYHLESSSEMGRHVVLEQTTFCLYKTPWITVKA